MARLIKFFENYDEEYVNKLDFQVGDIVEIDETENNTYKKYLNTRLKITNVATRPEDDEAFNIMIGDALYSFEVERTGQKVPFKLYDFELKNV